MSLPKIKKIEFGDIRINDDVVKDNDVVLHNDGFDQVDRSKKLSQDDIDKIMLRDPSDIVIGTGFKGKFEVPEDLIKTAEDTGIRVHIIQTDRAFEKFKELARSGNTVVARIHTGI